MSASAPSEPPRYVVRRRARRSAPAFVREAAKLLYDRPIARGVLAAVALIAAAWLIADVWQALSPS